MKKMSTREAYGRAITEFGATNQFFVLDADLSKATRTDIFAKQFPSRFFNMGIAECDMMSTAAGMATCGKKVFASTFAMFATGRAYEQIRNSIAYPKLNVKIAATHGGVLIGPDGGSHQCIEDISLMRTIPGMVVLAPADAVEARAVVEAAIEYDGPVYMRFGRSDVPIIYDTENFEFKIGKGKTVLEGNDLTIIAIGDMVYEAMEAAKHLKEEGIEARVIDMCSVKPIDIDLIIKAANETGRIVTVEDHNIIGGLGSAVSEVLAENCPVSLKRIGIMDVFGRSGQVKELAEYFGINAKAIIDGVKELLVK
ncbi:transketolase family protein [Pelosinus propionicus]|uniref:Transketolase subunit B n=1 Tax=Pelosinus propionicus DSM 13327 TaxID=1123291 RepID=A0A1I4M3S0_9FIRM|nr:transketolase family protein [Pelosinus propionicus]SFL97854.1 transketolase subunit B [Pelosinus propionicus DSM 13327]